MGQVNTVRGPVDAASLGATLMHEHVFVRTPEVVSNWPTGWDPKARVAQAVERLQELHQAGIGTIVDLTVVGLGRDIELVQQVADQLDLHIVVATGLYTYNDLPHFFDYRTGAFRPNGVDILDEFFLYDIENGIADSGVRPGILKCATDEEGLTAGVERVLARWPASTVRRACPYQPTPMPAPSAARTNNVSSAKRGWISGGWW